MARYFIANWKMNMSTQDAVRFATVFAKQYKRTKAGDHTVLCPSFLSLSSVASAIKKNKAIALGAQDVSWEEQGNYTGEVSPLNLKKTKVAYCIIGHSERRLYLNETDAMVNKKIRALLRVGITPILCIGETNAERLKNKTKQKLTAQLTKALAGVPDGKRLIIAYEPIWAISKGGKGTAMSSAIIEKEILGIDTISKKLRLSKKFRNIIYIYGGSVSAQNIRTILTIPLVDGVLVGNASLAASSFLKMTR